MRLHVQCTVFFSITVFKIPVDIRRSGSAKTLKVMHGGKTPRWQGALAMLRHRGMESLKKKFDHLRCEEEEEESEETKDLETSNILGKSYKRTTRHKMPPRLPKFIETPGTVSNIATIICYQTKLIDTLLVRNSILVYKRIHLFTVHSLFYFEG